MNGWRARGRTPPRVRAPRQPRRRTSLWERVARRARGARAPRGVAGRAAGRWGPAPPHTRPPRPGRRQLHDYFLTDAGVEYLRKYLALPEAIVPVTHMRPAARAARAEGAEMPVADVSKEKGPREGGYRREGGFGRGSAPRA